MIAADEPTSDETKHRTWASRAIDAAGKPCRDMEELAAALGRAWWGYQGWRAGDAEPGAGVKQKALDSLMRQSRRFRKALEEYGSQAAPGLDILSRAADERVNRIRSEIAALDRKREAIRSEDPRSPLLNELSSQRFQMDQHLIYAEDHPARGMIAHLYLGLAHLENSLDIVFEWEKSQTPRGLYAGWSDDPDHVAALRWLITEELSEIYRAFFDPLAKWKRPPFSMTNEVPSGPWIRFTLTVLDDMGIKNKQGEPFHPRGLVEYLRPSRKRSRVTGKTRA